MIDYEYRLRNVVNDLRIRSIRLCFKRNNCWKKQMIEQEDDRLSDLKLINVDCKITVHPGIEGYARSDRFSL